MIEQRDGVRFDGNLAEGGGGLGADGGTITNSVFYDNAALNWDGGGVSQQTNRGAEAADGGDQNHGKAGDDGEFDDRGDHGVDL